MKVDGFVEVGDDALSDPAYNAERLLNEFSPFADHERLVCRPGRRFVDRFYGQVYDEILPDGQAIYGRSDAFPPGPDARLANHGFLRVPFRRVPRRVVASRAELERAVADVPLPGRAGALLFRGQTAEHLLGRNTESSVFLYGDPAAAEPSLVTSASRADQPLEDVLPEWALLIRLFLRDQLESIRARTARRRFEEIAGERARFSASPVFHMFAVALAQHYGLPTAGLDVTHRLDVALFFALMKYESLGAPYARYRPVDRRERLPVVYVLYPDERFQTCYDDHRPRDFPRGRPDAQGARFMPCSWGYSINNCARSIRLALYLDPDGDFAPIPDADALFPGVDEDSFARFLLSVAGMGLPPGLRRAFERFYIVATPAG